MKRLLFSFLTVAFAAPVSLASEPQTVPDDKNAVCLEKANAFFKDNYKERSEDDNSIKTWRYESFYSGKPKKCYVKLYGKTVSKTPEVAHNSEEQVVAEVNERRQYAIYYYDHDLNRMLACHITGDTCKSKADWDETVERLFLRE